MAAVVGAQRLSRRWLLLAAAATGLTGLGAARAARPAGPVDTTAEALRERIRGSAALPYVGYAQSVGRLGLPELPQLEGPSGC